MDLQRAAYTAADEPALLAFLAQARPLAWQADFPSRHDLAALLRRPDIRAATCLWRDGAGDLAAYALVDQYGILRFDWLPPLAAQLIDPIVAWGITVAAVVEPALCTPCRADDELRAGLLTARQFVLQSVRTLYYARPLAEPLPPAQLPPGYHIRAYTEADCDAWVDLHQAAFGTEYMNAAERQAIGDYPGYESALDLVAVAADGSLAAYCVGGISAADNELTGRREGYTDPVATHPAHQRRGLARALLLYNLQQLRQRGLDTATLGTSSDNAAMRAAAEATGFSVRAARCWYERQLLSRQSPAGE